VYHAEYRGLEWLKVWFVVRQGRVNPFILLFFFDFDHMGERFLISMAAGNNEDS
jgi:hypothetical protein